MPDPSWRLLGEMLRRHREDLDPRYAGHGGLTLFAAERGINRRVAWDAENGKRDNYTRATRREIEIAYGLPVRAIDEFLTEITGTGRPRYADPAKDALAAQVWRQNTDGEGPVFGPDVLRGVVEFLWQHRQQDTGAPSVHNGERAAAAG